MNYNVELNTYGQNIEVFIEQRDGKWVLVCEGDEVASIPEEDAEDAEDAEWVFEHECRFDEIIEWCEEEHERELKEWEDYRQEVIATYWQNAI